MSWYGPAHAACAKLSVLLGQTEQARHHLERSEQLLSAVGGLGYLAWTLHDRARLELSVGDRRLAEAHATRARDLAKELSFDDLEQRSCQILGQIGSQSQASELPTLVEANLRGPALVIQPEGEIWTLSLGSEVIRLRATKGIVLLSRLVAEPEREFHVLDLESPQGSIDGGDSGSLLDEEALSNYRSRLRHLDAQLTEAEDFQDLARAESLRSEREFLTQELARAVGKGGSVRRSGSAVERARVNVQRRLKDATKRISAQSKAMGRQVSRSLKTGTYCSYVP
jgi:hypothetical protein